MIASRHLAAESFPLLSRQCSRSTEGVGHKGASMSEILIKNADAVVTMNAARAELSGADVLIRGGVIAAVGTGLTAPGAHLVQARG